MSVARPREVTGIIAHMTLAYVIRVLGGEAAAAVVQAAGDDRPLEQLLHNEEWSTVADVVALAEAAAAACGEADLGRRVGEELLRHHTELGSFEFLRAAGTPQAAMELCVDVATKMSAGRSFQISEVGDRSVVVESTTTALEAIRHPFFCGMAAAYFSAVPTLFGAVGVVAQPECLGRGDERCRLVLTWDRAPEEPDWERNEAHVALAIGRFEELQAMASELAMADDVSTVLDRIVWGVSVTMMAPRFLLAVRLDEGDDVHVHHLGFDGEAGEADEAAAALLGGEGLDRYGTPLVADVASGARRYGRLAAFFPTGTEPTDVERRYLDAYAAHAGAALRSVANLETARTNHDTAFALLQLAEALSRVDSRDDVADRLARAVPLVTGCEIAAVWLWDAGARCLRLAGASPADIADAGGQSISAEAVPGLASMAVDPQPTVVDATTAGAPLSALMREWGVDRSFVMPIIAGREFVGMVTASVTGNREIDTEQLFSRLLGVAHHAATAFHNASLLERVSHQALHDALTGLPNRPLVQDRAESALKHAARSGHHVALLFVDLDRFKNVNDTLGHTAGDELIRQVAARLASCVRASDTIARLGGDEFVVLLPDLGSGTDAVPVAKKINEAVRDPFEINGQRLYISLSIGVASFPNHGGDYETLMKHADAAMYEAKARGRNTFAVHSSRSGESRHVRLQLESELHLAVEREEFDVVYQPQLDLETMEIVGIEALVRWDHPTFGRVAPDVFLPLAEETGLIVDIDEWVRRRALQQGRRWAEAGTPVRMALNLSNRDLRNPDLPKQLADLVAESRLDPQLVELEITDRVVMSSDDLPEVLAQLKQIGVRLAIDDFGTGNSVIGRLQRCAVDVLKIDRTFIAELTSNESDRQLVNALVSMAHALGLQVVAEGIETSKQASILRRYACDYGQGYLFSPPVDAAAITELLTAAAPSTA